MFNAAEEGKSLRTTMKGGTGNGLEIMLDIQQDEYLPVWGDTGGLRLSTSDYYFARDRADEKVDSLLVSLGGAEDVFSFTQFQAMYNSRSGDSRYSG